MTTKRIHICDHCGAECADKYEFSLFGEWMRPEAEFTPDRVHGCTREHALLAVAKAIGIGVDGKAAEIIALISRERDNAQKEADRLRGKLEDAEQERDTANPHQCTPCPTWREPEYGNRCRACGGSKEEHEGRA